MAQRGKTGKGMKPIRVETKKEKLPERGTVARLVYEKGKKPGQTVFLTASR